MRGQESGVRDQGTRPAGPCARLALAAFLLIPLGSLLVPSASAQSVVDVLQRQRRDARVAEILAEIGDRQPARPPVELGDDVPAVAAFRAVQAGRQAARDSLVAAEAARADSLILAAQLATLDWRKVEPGAQDGFVEAYAEAYWQAADPRPGLVDSLQTPALRGRLQAAFGRPTRNADAQRRYGYGGSEYVQFEYWFVVNDSIPVLALDIDGPFGRGTPDRDRRAVRPDPAGPQGRPLGAARRRPPARPLGRLLLLVRAPAVVPDRVQRRRRVHGRGPPPALGRARRHPAVGDPPVGDRARPAGGPPPPPAL